MVFFTCNACGQSVKKNQVEKHYQVQCRNCTVLSCMDCGKDFHGDEYKKHTKCISEDQKYGGKDYKAPINKGEAKQEQWIERIHNAIATTKVSKDLETLLEQLTQFNNIPRKKIKFENFIKHSVRIRNPKLVTEAWEIFSKAVQPVEKNTRDVKTDGEADKVLHSDDKLQNGESINKDVKKFKKRKVDDNELSNVENNEKHKKKKKTESVDVCEHEQASENHDVLNDNSMTQDQDPNNDYMKSKNGKRKFKWQHAIRDLLAAADDQELSVKKLKKKVLALYSACGGESKPMSENDLRAKLEKKINKNKQLKVHKDRVKLIS